MSANNAAQYFANIDRFAVNLSHFVQKNRWLVIIGLILVALTIASGAQHLQFSSNYRVFFSSENPELTAFEQLQETYTKNDNFLFVIEPKDESAITPTTLSAVAWLTEESWQIPFASRVDSITNFQHTYAIDDDLIVEDLVSEPEILDAAALKKIRDIALAEPLLNNLLISANTKATAVNVTLQYPEQSMTEVPEAVAFARNLRDQLQANHPHLTVSLSGVSMLNNAFSEAGLTDSATLTPLMFLVILIVAMIAVRSLVAVISTLIVIVLSGVVGMGTAGFLGLPLTPISASAPTVIMTLAIADSIHILISLRSAMRAGLNKSKAITQTIKLNFLPVTITSLTTIVGFLTLNFSDSPPFWHLGNITAIGILSAWVLSLTLLPALISALPYRVKAAPDHQAQQQSSAMTHLADWVIKHGKPLLVFMGVGSMGLIAFIPKIELNDQWVSYFDQRIEFRNESDHALQYFGLYPIEYSVPAPAPGAVSDPDYLKAIEAFSHYLREQPEVTHVYSLSDIMKRLNKNLNADQPEFYRIPQERELSAQYLLLYELSLPYGLDLNDRINIDKSATRITATLKNLSTAETKAFLNRTQSWINENLPESMQTMRPTSAQVMFTYISERNVNNMIEGTLIAIVAIALIMMLSLRNLKLGLLSLVPNALPIFTTFGAWALLVGEVGFSVATVSSISLGIIVDDTVHLLTKFARARRELNHTPVEAVRHAFNHVGVAILTNTVVLACGFLVLTYSAFKVNTDMGMLTAMAIVFALVLDFFLLPALLVVLAKTGPQSNPPNAPEETNMNKNKMQKSLSNALQSQSWLLPALTMTVALLLSAISMPSIAAATDAPTDTSPQTPDNAQKGFDIAARSDRTDNGFGDSVVKLTMTLKNAAGQETSRALEIKTLEKENEEVGDKSLVLFNSPKDIKGTALLSHAKILDPDNQWLFLPALKRVKRIASKNKSGPFVGSEFAFEDFTSLELNKYRYEWLREEPCGEFTCDVVVRHPEYKDSGYKKQISWIDQTHHQVRKVDYYNRRDALLKTLTLTDYRQYETVWRAHVLTMVNHQNKKETELRYDTYQFKQGLSKSDFVKNRLTKLR